MNAMLNPSVLGEIRTHRITFSDTTMPLLSLRYQRGLSKDPEAPTDFCRLTIDANGSDASKLILFLDIGASVTDYTQYQFAADGVVVTDPDGVDSSPTCTAVTTLGALITALKDVDGITVFRLHAPADYSLDTDDFVDLAATEVQSNFPLETLFKDVSEVHVAHRRIGNPEPFDSGRMKLIGLNGTITGITSGTVKIIEDPDDEDATKEVELDSFAMVTAETAYVADDVLSASIYRGPLLIELSSSDMSACDIKIREQQAEY